MSAKLIRRSFAKDQSGATAVEFAMVMPVFVVCVLGVLEFGLAQHQLSTIRFAMQTASRQLMLNPNLTSTQMAALVNAQISGRGDTGAVITMNVADTAAGKIATVTAAYTSQVGIPSLASIPYVWTTSVSTPLPSS